MKAWLTALQILALGCAVSAHADDLSKRYPLGAGSRFSLTLGNDIQAIDVSIYVANSSRDQVAIETYFTASVLGAPLELWEQSILRANGSSVELAESFILNKDLKAPERVPKSAMHDGEFDIQDFLFADGKQVEKFKVGVETVTVPAGTVQATHYRQKKGTDTIDFWVSDEARPIGLVKLALQGKNPFGMALQSVLSNVKGKIDPRQAVPLTDKGRELLKVPGASALVP